eukprot:6202164-Pleurochrysis_carterae.AAC.2
MKNITSRLDRSEVQDAEESINERVCAVLTKVRARQDKITRAAWAQLSPPPAHEAATRALVAAQVRARHAAGGQGVVVLCSLTCALCRPPPQPIALSARRMPPGKEAVLVLVGDCGGTNTRLQLYAVSPSATVTTGAKAPGDLVYEKHYLNAAYGGFEEVRA